MLLRIHNLQLHFQLIFSMMIVFTLLLLFFINTFSFLAIAEVDVYEEDYSFDLVVGNVDDAPSQGFFLKFLLITYRVYLFI